MSLRRLIFSVLLLSAIALRAADNSPDGPESSRPNVNSNSGAAQIAAATVSPGSLNPARKGLTLPRNAKVMIVPVNDDESTKYGMIDDWQANFIERRLKRAQAESFDLVILEIHTQGGSIAACDQINKAIAKCNVPVIAFVNDIAFSGGALISLGSRMIVVAPNSIIGGAKAVTLWGSDIDPAMKMKVNSELQAMVSNLARTNGYPEPIAIGMVNSDAEIYELADPERFVTGDRLADMERQRGGKPNIIRTWKKKDTILSVTGVEAFNIGLASGIASNTDEIFTGLGIQPASVEIASVTAAEKVARAISNPIWRVLLIIIGVVGLFWELKAPGHGVGYMVFAFCLGVFFWLQIFSNSAGLWEVALFGLGAVLVAAEIFIFPGFGAAGFIGFGLILVSIVLSFIPEGVTFSTIFGGKDSVPEWDRERAVTALLWAAVSLASICMIAMLGLIKGVKLPGLNRLALNAEVTSTVNSGVAAVVAAETGPASAPPMLGKTGVTETVLRPAGKVRLEGVTYDAVSEGVHIDQGEAVTVLSQRGSTLVVRALGS